MYFYFIISRKNIILFRYFFIHYSFRKKYYNKQNIWYIKFIRIFIGIYDACIANNAILIFLLLLFLFSKNWTNKVCLFEFLHIIFFLCWQLLSEIVWSKHNNQYSLWSSLKGNFRRSGNSVNSWWLRHRHPIIYLVKSWCLAEIV